jgi:ABC-2 type transport system ATP-binding protein
MDNEVAVRVEELGVKFNLNSEKVDSIKEYIIKAIKGELRYDEFWALQDINFELYKGDRLGILGLNGSGKSTLLKLIADVYKPTEGTVFKDGKVVPLIELGAGFDPQYTGRENIYLYGSVMGVKRSFMAEKYDEIVEYAELERFIDVPLKNYSSGMRARLGFSIATVLEPDILILDEILSVGDAKFRIKCEERIQSMLEKGVTVLFVSHSIDQVSRICNKAMILDNGRMIAFGPTEKVAKYYNERIVSN